MDMFLGADADQALKITGSFSLSPRNGKRHADSLERSNAEPPLKFHLVTSDKHGGYNLIFSHKRIDHLRRILNDCNLSKLTIDETCGAIVGGSSDSPDPDPRIVKRQFDASMKSVLKWNSKVSADSKRTMTGLLDSIFSCFDRDGVGKPSVVEVVCGMTIFSQGKKSDKLEYAFEMIDQKKRNKLSKRDMNRYLQAFLTVLFGIAICPCLDIDPAVDTMLTFAGDKVERTPASVFRAVKAGAEWATSLIFREMEKPQNSFLTFDDFATWYTSKGHASIPWLELIDLRKWVLQS